MSDVSLDLETFLPYRLNRLAEAVGRRFSQVYKERYGLTRPEWRLLATLGQHGTMTATDIGAHSSMHKTKVSRAVVSLEQRRWLVRQTHRSDRRVENLSLTKAGLAVYRELVPVARAFEEALLGGLADPDRKAVASGLEALERLQGSIAAR
ncbi:MarR family transcriptional regulator [Mesorhizobium sp. Z1-4]|uniref:MarR family winged helix-turn-helix transcriptional regulator n=1 Tax=Mesorhizobium sp. Z1-4 TaxID=2448478 RepID=UPI000FD9C4C2|nr:MarR family transcriptional regulator [Mesorhizobium sp. Z1-4]